MNREPLRRVALDDPQLRALLPLLYVVWSDGALSPRELDAVRERVANMPWLRPAAREVAASWLQPDSPPSAEELASLARTVRAAAANLAVDTRATLVSLARALAPGATAEDGPLGRTEPRETPLDGTPLDGSQPNGTPLDGRQPDGIREVATLLGVEDESAATHGLVAREIVALPAVGLDVAAWRTLLDRDHPEVRADVRRFLDVPERRAYGLPVETYRALVRTWLASLAAEGFGRLAFPRVTTDAPDLGRFFVAFEALAYGDLSLLVKFGVQFGLFGGSVYFLGTERHHAMLDDVASLALPGCFAMSEVGHGSNVGDLETTAVYDHARRELVIHTPRESARKEWIGGAARDARVATVFVQLEVDGARHGVHAVLVPLRDEHGALLPGVRAGDSGTKMGLNGVDNGRLWFDHVRVPVANLLDRFASIDDGGRYVSPIASPSRRFFTMLGTLVGGRVSVGSAGTSVAKVALAIAIRYAVVRRQFGPDEQREVPLLAYPTHQRRLLVPLATTYVHHFAFEALRAHFVEVFGKTDADTRVLEAEAAGMKVLATRHATDTVQAARLACGGQGYLSVNRLPDLKADSDVFATFEGDNHVLLQLVGKSVLSEFSRELSRGGAVSLARYIARRAATEVLEKNPIAARDTDREHLRGRDFLLAAFRHRQTVVVSALARRAKKRLDRGVDAHEALLGIQEHLVAAAEAYVERLALERFYERIDDVRDPTMRAWLDRLGALHALAKLEAWSGWFLEDGYFARPKARAVRKEVESLLRELVPAARELVDAFGIPDHCLAAPIAFFDPAHPFADPAIPRAISGAG